MSDTSESDDSTISPSEAEQAEPFDEPITEEEPQAERGEPGSRPAAGEGEATTKRVPDPSTEEHTVDDEPGVDPRPTLDEDMTRLPPGG
jgi:hypothetical protein